MGKKFYPGVPVPSTPPVTKRLGAQNVAFTSAEFGKIVKFSNSTEGYVLAAAGDLFDGIVNGVEQATSDGYAVGGVQRHDDFFATADGIQADGTGSLAVGDAVVCGTVVAQGTALTAAPKVRKATLQPGAVPADLTAAGVAMAALAYWWKVVSLQGGNGSVGTTVLVQRMVAN